MPDYKTRTRNRVVEIYNKYGLDTTMKVVDKMLLSSRHKSDKTFRADLHGELCEVVLELHIVDFMKRNKEKTKDWFYEKGMILKNPDKGTDYFTEVDMIVFTPHKFLVIECKSYAGRKVFTDVCTVTRGKFVKDVYKQHKAHFEALHRNFNKCRHTTDTARKYSPFKVGYFDYSDGEIVDKRDDKSRLMMPILDITNIDKFLSTQLDKPATVNLELVRKTRDIISKHKKTNTKKHLKFVKGLQ